MLIEGRERTTSVGYRTMPDHDTGRYRSRAGLQRHGDRLCQGRLRTRPVGTPGLPVCRLTGAVRAAYAKDWM